MAIAGGFAHVLAQSSPQIICVPLAGGEAPSHLGGHVCSGAGPAATNAQGTLVAVGRKDGRITVRLPSSASPLATMQAVSGFVGGVAALAISPNGHMCVYCCSRCTSLFNTFLTLDLILFFWCTSFTQADGHKSRRICCRLGSECHVLRAGWACWRMCPGT